MRYLFYVLTPFLFACNIENQSATEETNDAVDQIFAHWNKPTSPGCALAVIQEGKIVYSKGYGMADLEHDIPITPEGVFYAGSVSKQFVAMCMLLLEEQGKLSLDDEVQKYVPELPNYEQPI